MCNCKDLKNLSAAKKLIKSGANVEVNINVTNIVKYVCLAGVAIVGIIFGTRGYIEYRKNENDKEEN